MKIHLHIGLEHVGAARLQAVMAKKRSQLAEKGVLYPSSPGNKNHTRLFMAATDPDHVDPLRFNRGFADPKKQALLREQVVEDLSREVAQHAPDRLILSASQLGTSLARKSEVQRLREMLTPLSRDITLVAHVDRPADLLARHYAEQVMEGRSTALDRELALADAPDWWQA